MLWRMAVTQLIFIHSNKRRGHNEGYMKSICGRFGGRGGVGEAQQKISGIR